MKFCRPANLLPPIFLILFLLTVTQSASAQQSLSSDELFTEARNAAFNKKDYPLAITLAKQALVKSPGYSDIHIFIGRIYTWRHELDSAREQFSYVLQRHPGNLDASSAFTDLEYWNDNDTAALRYCNEGLKYHPGSSELLLKKARILNNMRRYNEAYAIADSLLKTNPKNSAARALAAGIRNNSSRNKIGISYDYVHFDQNYPSSDPWHLASVDYTRQTRLGSVTGRINYANRFQTNGVQAEIDAYPHISSTFYSYVNAGYSGSIPVFPKFRAGYSLYANLPKSFEGELGFRYLYFSSSTWIYTASVGKYYKNYWFNLRTYLIPDNPGLSQSYTLTARLYSGGADDYFAIALGTGISPDDRATSVQLRNTRLLAKKASLEYRRSFHKLNIVSISGTYINEEIKSGVFGNQFDIGISCQRRF